MLKIHVSISKMSLKNILVKLLPHVPGANELISQSISTALMWIPHRADSRLAPSQWETLLQSTAVSHWLGANLESALPQEHTDDKSEVQVME